MKNLSYCVKCRRISYFRGTCSYCQSDSIKPINRKAPVNVIGTKIKGKVLNVKAGMVDILCVGEGNVKLIRQYEAEKLRKIL